MIVAHNLGDAVIQSKFVRELAASSYACEYLVWTRPQVAFLFDGIPACDVICSQFPIGTSKQFGGNAAIKFLRAAVNIRARRPSVTIDLIGDFRDRLFARLIGSRRHVYIGWAANHAFSRLIRNPFGTGTPTIVVPAEVLNVYDAHQLLLDSLRPSTSLNAGAGRSWSPCDGSKRLVIGLHPFASQACKLWPRERWCDLAGRLVTDERTTVVVFGAPSEAAELKSIFGSVGGGRVTYVTASLTDFADEVSKLDVMVGLDSFSVHMAQRQGVRSVLINAGNPPGLWAPPASTVLSRTGDCPYYPCFNIPQCTNTKGENACVNAITVTDVINAIYAEFQPWQ